jgi:hypothetical protein
VPEPPTKRRRVKLERYASVDATTAHGCPIAAALKAAFGPNRRFAVDKATGVRCRDCDRSLWVGKTKTGAFRLDGLERHLEGGASILTATARTRTRPLSA